MKKKKLIIIDLHEDSKFHYNDVLYIYLNKGRVNLKNSKRLYLEPIRKNNFLSLKKKFNNVLLEKVNKS